VSHAEWVQNLQAVFWDADRVDGYLRRTLVRAFDAVWSLATNREVSPRQAAYMLGVARVAEAIRHRGVVP
jgi:glutamate dehydrogenase/leucine dehydrogenase